jgi:hypothetical protein
MLKVTRRQTGCKALMTLYGMGELSSRLGKLTRQGSAELRWALYEAAQSARRPASSTTPTISRSKPADSPTPARR